MDTVALLTFALALLLATASPGPAIAALLARVIARGAAGVVPFGAGLILGDILWLGAAVLGLSVLAQTAQPVFQAIKWAGVGYLLFLAWRLWTAPAAAPATVPAPRGEGWRLFGGALLLTLGNPKVVVFYTALVPAVIDLSSVDVPRFALLAVILAVVFAGVLAGWTLLALRARTLLRSAAAVRRVNRAAALGMGGAAVAVAAR